MEVNTGISLGVRTGAAARCRPAVLSGGAAHFLLPLDFVAHLTGFAGRLVACRRGPTPGASREGRASRRRRIAAQVTFVPFGGTLFRITAVAPSSKAKDFIARARVTARSFGPLPDEARDSIRVLRLRLAQAQGAETLAARVQSAFDPSLMAVLNGVFVDHVFKSGEWVKFVRAEPYRP